MPWIWTGAQACPGRTRLDQGAIGGNLAPRYIMSIENKGQHPSLQVFYELATLFHISVDPFFFPEDPATQSPRRRQLNADLDTLSESDLLIIKAAIDGIRRAKAESAQ